MQSKEAIQAYKAEDDVTGGGDYRAEHFVQGSSSHRHLPNSDWPHISKQVKEIAPSNVYFDLFDIHSWYRAFKSS
jgi:hypothetical protein